MNARKTVKTVVKRTAQVVLGLVVFVYLVVALLNTTVIQSFTAAGAAHYFSQQWHTKVSIGALSVTPFIHAGIKDIYVEDLHKDTLLYASYLEANLASIPKGSEVQVRNLELKDAVCNLVKRNGKFNFQFIIDYFASDKPKQKKESKPFGLKVNDILLKNVDFALIDYEKQQPVIKGLFNPNRIICKDICLEAKSFSMLGMQMSADIINLQAKERCGIELQQFRAEVDFSPQRTALHNALIRTQSSVIDCDIQMNMSSLKTYSYFVDSVLCQVDIRQGTCINLKDACWWSEKVRGADQKVYLDCKINGTVADMDIERLDVQVQQTHVNADGRIKGLTDVANTRFDVKINDISTSYKDYLTMNLGTLLQGATVPQMADKLGVVNVMGEFNGTLQEFDGKLEIAADLGTLDLTANARKQADNQVKYTADIVSSDINAGVLTDNTMLRHTALDAHAELTGTNPSTMRGNLDAKLTGFYFNGNNYDRVALHGEIDGYDITANASINDGAVNFDGDVFVNYDKKPNFAVDANIVNMDLHKMHFVDFADTNTVISAKVKAQVNDFDINNLNLNALLQDVDIKMSGNEYKLNSVSLVTQNDTQSNNILLRSDIIDADLKGIYTFNTLSEDVAYILNKYIPDFSAVMSEYQHKKTLPHNDGTYIIKSDAQLQADIKDISLLNSLFDLKAYVLKPVSISAMLNPSDVLTCQINAPHVDYSQYSILGTDINLAALGDRLTLSLNADSFDMTDSLGFRDIRINSELDSTYASLKALLVQKQDSTTNADITLKTVIDSNGLQGSFENTSFNIQGTQININDNHMIGISNGKVSLINFMVSSMTSNITIDGAVGKDDVLLCKFTDVDLSLVNPFISSYGMTVSGTLNKDVVLRNILQSFSFTSDLEADNLAVNGVYLGKAWLNVDNNLSPDIFSTDIKFLYYAENNEVVPLHVNGIVAPNADKEQLDLNVNMQNFQLAVIKTFISSFASDVEGSLSCENLTVKGRMQSPDIQGTLHCNNAGLKVNMLNTKYWIDDDISVYNNKISFKDFVLKDEQSNKITVNGDITHHNFASFDINLNAVADRIKILDTKAGNGEMYYGKAYASANVNIVGDSNMINISGNARTEPGTSLTVPVTSKENAQENEFITFVSANTSTDSSTATQNQPVQERSMGYNISIDLNVNPNAKLYIPMDFTQLKGDLAAAGNGDLKIAMNSDGKFSMIGEVAIDNGTFKFNILDVMEKNFVLQQGGTLTWNGDPAGGILDVTAVYKTKTSLASILGNNFSKPVDVESIIRLSGVMTNPQPSFDINLPGTDDQTVEKVFMNIDKSNEKVMLEQTASILLTNQFYYSEGSYQTEALQSGVTSSLMGVAFSQLSGMLTNMVKIVDVNLNYTSSGTGTNLSDQLDANISKSYGKWEVSVNASIGGSGTTQSSSEFSNIIGDGYARYRYTDNLQFEIFNHSNANDFTKYNISPYTQGVSLIYKKEYQSVKDIFKRKKKNAKK